MLKKLLNCVINSSEVWQKKKFLPSIISVTWTSCGLRVSAPKDAPHDGVLCIIRFPTSYCDDARNERRKPSQAFPWRRIENLREFQLGTSISRKREIAFSVRYSILFVMFFKSSFSYSTPPPANACLACRKVWVSFHSFASRLRSTSDRLDSVKPSCRFTSGGKTLRVSVGWCNQNSAAIADPSLNSQESGSTRKLVPLLRIPNPGPRLLNRRSELRQPSKLRIVRLEVERYECRIRISNALA